MPEGDTLFRTAAGLRPYLVGRRVIAARTGGPGALPQVERVVGQEITAVDALGKNLLIRFGNGLEIRTHLRMNGSWHRYRPGEPWRRPPARARLVLEVPGAVAVCFDAPVVELLEQRAEALHPSLGRLGPDLLAPDFDPAEAVRRLRDPARASTPIGEAIVDQRALAGIGNVYKSEVLWIERVAPSTVVADLDDATLTRLVTTAQTLLRANAGPGAGRRAGPERVTTGARPPRHRAALRLRPDGPPMPPLRHADPQHATGSRAARARRTGAPTCQPVEALASAETCVSTSSPGPRSRSGSTSCGRSPSASSGSGSPGLAGARPGSAPTVASSRIATCAPFATIPDRERVGEQETTRPRWSTFAGRRGCRP